MPTGTGPESSLEEQLATTKALLKELQQRYDNVCASCDAKSAEAATLRHELERQGVLQGGTEREVVALSYTDPQETVTGLQGLRVRKGTVCHVEETGKLYLHLGGGVWEPYAPVAGRGLT